MPRAAKACSTPNCNHLQPCPLHPQKAWEGSTRRKRLPKGWRKLRARVLRRDRTCTVCGAARASEVHHLNGWQDNREEALAGICGPCHAKESSREGNRAQGADV